MILMIKIKNKSYSITIFRILNIKYIDLIYFYVT